MKVKHNGVCRPTAIVGLTLPVLHYDVIRWKHFPRFSPSMPGNASVTGGFPSRWNSNADPNFFVVILSKMFDWLVIRGAMTVIWRCQNANMWSDLCNLFETNIHVDEIYACTIFKWVAVTWLKIGHLDSSPILGYMPCVHDDVIKWKRFPRYWPFVRGIHRSPVNSSHKGQWRGALMFSLICAWINGWVNNHKAGDLRRYRAHYDVTVMMRRDDAYVTVCTYQIISSQQSIVHPWRQTWGHLLWFYSLNYIDSVSIFNLYSMVYNMIEIVC